jgi:A/G-specific adenine glycosylase
LRPRAVAAIRAALLEHFDAHQRDLPWRANRDPYRVWVSEVMLQQTRVDTVRSYYDRWLRRFPTVRSLAEAPLDDVLKSWEGLGYYSRARNLHRAAQIVCERHRGELPAEISELRALPGIGEYTAGAVASIAFRKAEPVVDGNVRRVLHRLLDAPRLSAPELRAAAATLVQGDRPGEFNQAIMELGATICTPRAPRCSACPIHTACAAHERGTQLERPAAAPRRRIPEREFVTLILIDSAGRTLLRRRPSTGLLASLWEFPSTQDDAAGFAAKLTGCTVTLTKLGTVSHTFSHFRAHYHVHHARLPRAATSPRDELLRWATLAELTDYALPAAQRRIAALIPPARELLD